MPTKRLFAVDLGASGGKCFVGTFSDGAFAIEEIHRFAHEGVPTFIPDQDGNLVERTVWDDVFIYRNILTGLKAYRRSVSDSLDSIGIDTWGADGAIMSAKGDMLGPMYCYRDHRLDDMVAKVKAQVDPRRVYELTGIHFQFFNMSNQLNWFAGNRPELMLPGAYMLPVPSLFNHALCGSRAVDSSWASVTQLMKAGSLEWSDEILQALNIPASIMPEIVPPGTVLGALHAPLAKLVGLNQATVIAVAAHDTAAAFAAAPIEDPDDALIISSGTWSLVGRLIPEPITSVEAMDAGISNEGGIGNIRFLKNVMGTWLVQELRRLWADEDGEETHWDDLDATSMAATPFGILVDPDDPSFANPPNMQEAIDAVCRKTGQAVPANRGEYVRLVFESLALKYRFVSEQLAKACGKSVKVVNVVGGGSKNVMLNQFTADALGVPVVAGPNEATAVGNLMVQAMGLGLIDSMQEALPLIRSACALTEYQPRDTASWDAAYETFCRLVR